jgi:alanyl aminopeptidase
MKGYLPNVLAAGFVASSLLLFVRPGSPRAEPAMDDPLRLADDVRPTFQTIELRLDPQSTSFSGSVHIDLEVRAATSRFRFHARSLTLERVVLRGPGGEVAASHEIQPEGDLVRIETAAPLAPGRYELAIEFGGTFNTKAESLYRVVSEGNSYLFTQFESSDARGAFPCWDEPRFKIPFQTTLEIPEGQVAVSNTPMDSQTVDDGWRRIVFARTQPMPTYLLAMAVGPLEAVPIEGLSVPGHVYTPRGKAHLAAEAVRVTPAILAALEAYFDRPYPYRKLDLIAVPEFWPGAMENVGAITFRDTLLLLDSESVSVQQLRSLCSVTAHEIAHQWFGDLVTMEWWDDLWLNESFASWLGGKITDQVFPEYGEAISSVEDAMRAMATDAQLSARTIRQPVSANENLLQTADVLAYEKGSAVLGMFEAFVGEDLFRKGVQQYIQDNEWANATADDLWSSLSTATGIDVGSAMATFLDQPGVPLVRATQLGDGRVEFRQQRFLNYGHEAPQPQTWKIPVVYRYHDGEQERTQKLLLTEESEVVELPGGKPARWIHPNAGEMGYYHWAVDADVLATLTGQSTELLSVRERAGLVGELSALLDAGEIEGGRYLDGIGHLAADPRPEVVDAAIRALGLVRVAFVTPERKERFAAYVRRVLQPVLERYGMHSQPGEAEAVTLLRPSLLAWLGIHGQDPAVRAYARQVTDTILADSSAVDPSIADVCLRVAAVEGDWKLYNQYKARFENAEAPRDRTRFLGAMGYFGDPVICKAALWYALHGKPSPTEMFSIPRGAGTLHGDTDLVWNWMTENYADIRAKIPEMFAIYLPYFASGCSRERLAAAEVFFSEPSHSVKGQEKEMAKVAESVNDCVSLREREGAAVAAYLENFLSMQ